MRVDLNERLLHNRVLNEALFCHASPAATSRYMLRLLKGAAGTRAEQVVDEEEQKSSGLWVGPAAGSTAAQRSAGGAVLPLTSQKIQFVVREPYVGADARTRMTVGLVEPKARLEHPEQDDPREALPRRPPRRARREHRRRHHAPPFLTKPDNPRPRAKWRGAEALARRGAPRPTPAFIESRGHRAWLELDRVPRMTAASLGFEIIGTGHYVPGKPVKNDDLARVMDTSDEWIFKRSGIRQRHYCARRARRERPRRRGGEARDRSGRASTRARSTTSSSRR